MIQRPGQFSQLNQAHLVQLLSPVRSGLIPTMRFILLGVFLLNLTVGASVGLVTRTTHG